MKKVIATLVIAVFAVIGLQIANVQAASYSRQKVTASARVGSTAQTPTTILKITAICVRGPLNGNGLPQAAPCYFGLRNGVGSGANLLAKDVYALSVSGGTTVFQSLDWKGQIQNTFSLGTYFSVLTGTIDANVEYLK